MHLPAFPVAAAPLWTAAPEACRAVIAIPARDEAERLPHCLAAIAAQRDIDAGRLAVLVLANGCRDATAATARALAPGLPFALHVLEARLPRRLAHAGGARRAALDAALGLLGPEGGVLLSTDADARPDPGWLAACLDAIAAGADAVAGAYRADAAELRLLPPALVAREAAEARYAALLDELAANLDPLPHDPWPRHATHSGASFALTAAAYRRIGGLPPLPLGEDRALFAALERVDARIRHAPEAMVTVSARLRGRARGGMAETLRRRARDPQAAPPDSRLLPVAEAWTRLCARRALRRLWQGRPGAPAGGFGISAASLRGLLDLPRFGLAWEALVAASPLLATTRRLEPMALPAETRRAAAILAALRPGAAGRAGSGDAAPGAARA
jgi:hypothetical protein